MTDDPGNSEHSPGEKRPAIDWERIEREYRAGQLSIREIAASCGVSHVAILKRAKRDSWERNLAEAVRERVTNRIVTDGVTGKSAAETVEVAAERTIQIVRSHRKMIGRGQRLVEQLFGELEEASEHHDEIEEAIEEETKDDKRAGRRSMMMRAIELPSRSSTLVNLSTALKTFVGLERQAFGVDADNSPANGPNAPLSMADLVSEVWREREERKAAETPRLKGPE